MKPAFLFATLLGLAFSGAALAQDRLPDLKSKRDRLESERSRVVATRDRAQGELRVLRDEFAAQNQALRELQAEDPLLPFLHRRKVEAARRELRLTSEHVTSVKRELERAELGERSLRLELIEAIRAYVNRLLVKAGQSADAGRKKQADTQYAGAVRELAYLDDLEALELDPGELRLPPLTEELELARGALMTRREAYRELGEETQARAEELFPKVQELQAELQRLETMAERGFALPHLGELIERTRGKLDRVAALHATLERRADVYRERVRALGAELNERARRPNGEEGQ